MGLWVMSRGHAAWVAAGIFLSRIAGLVREQVFAHYLGNSLAAGAFRAALRIPNFLQNLFGEGVLSASFIPVYSRLLASGDRALAGRVAGAVGAFLGLVVGLLSTLGVIATPWLVDLVAPGYTGSLRALTIDLVRILFPGVGLLAMSAWCLGILNSHRRFFVSYAAPVLWNVAMIVALVASGGLGGGLGRVDGALAVALAWGSVVGSLLQLGVLFVAVARLGADARALRFTLSRALAPVREVFSNLGPVFAGRGVVQISAWVDAMIASFLGASAVSALGYAQTLYLLPISLFGMSVAAAELPALSSVSRATGAEGDAALALRARMASGLAQVAFFVVPTAVGFLVLGDQIVAALFQGGKFDAEDTRFVSYLLFASSLGLFAAARGRLVSSAFYALGDTRTPFRFAIVRVSFSAAVGALFALPLRPLWTLIAAALGLRLPAGVAGGAVLGAIGLSFASALAAWIEYGLLRRALVRRIGALPKAAASGLGKVWTAALIAAVVVFGMRFVPALEFVTWTGRLGAIVRAAVTISAFGVAYFAVAAALSVPELGSALARFRRRSRRSTE